MFDAVFIITTLLPAPWFVTYAYVPLGENAIPYGEDMPAVIDPTTELVAVSIIATLFEPEFATYAYVPEGENATP